MKKSPLSRMNGNQSYSSPLGNRSSGGNRNNSQNPNRIMYDNFRNDNQAGNYQEVQNSGSDFIPFQTSSPMSQRNNSGNWQGSGGSYSGGYNNRRNNFYNSPGSNHSSPYSPFKNSSRQNYGKKVNIQFRGLETDIFQPNLQILTPLFTFLSRVMYFFWSKLQEHVISELFFDFILVFSAV